MRQLTSKDYFAYAPYGLYVKMEDDILRVKSLSIDFNDIWLNSKEGKCVFAASKDITLVLRPIRNLTIPLKLGDITVVPLIELAKKATSILEGWRIYRNTAVNGEDDDQYRFGYTRHGFELYHAVMGGHCSYDLVFNQAYMFDMLDEMLFDYRGLIKEGLAIDCTELENDPYLPKS